MPCYTWQRWECQCFSTCPRLILPITPVASHHKMVALYVPCWWYFSPTSTKALAFLEKDAHSVWFPVCPNSYQGKGDIKEKSAGWSQSQVRMVTVRCWIVRFTGRYGIMIFCIPSVIPGNALYNFLDLLLKHVSNLVTPFPFPGITDGHILGRYGIMIFCITVPILLL